jgi:hypothetical protein
MLGLRLITGVVLDEFIVDEAYAVTREYSQDLTVAFTLRNHGAITLSSSRIRLSAMAKSAKAPCRCRSVCGRLAAALL